MSRKPPKAYTDFVGIYPKLAEAWEKARDQESDGPLDEKTRRHADARQQLEFLHGGGVHMDRRGLERL